MTIDDSQSLAIRVAHLIAHCELWKARCEAKSHQAFKNGNEFTLALYDGKALVYDEMIDKLKLIKEFGK